MRYMDLYGISISVLHPIEPYRSTQSNLEVVGERLMTFASVHPEQAGWERRLETYMKGGCLGLKIHPIIQRLAPDNPGIMDLLEEYAPMGVPSCSTLGKAPTA